MDDDEPEPATLDDVPGIVDLVGEMYADMAEEYVGIRSFVSVEWVAKAGDALRERFGHDVTAFVIRQPSGRVVSVAVGRLHRTLPSPRRVGTIAGYVEWVATDVEMRRRGYARSVVTALMAWFEEQGAQVVDLTASRTAEPLYRQLGFDGEGPIALTRRI